MSCRTLSQDGLRYLTQGVAQTRQSSEQRDDQVGRRANDRQQGQSSHERALLVQLFSPHMKHVPGLSLVTPRLTTLREEAGGDDEGGSLIFFFLSSMEHGAGVFSVCLLWGSGGKCQGAC